MSYPVVRALELTSGAWERRDGRIPISQKTNSGIISSFVVGLEDGVVAAYRYKDIGRRDWDQRLTHSRIFVVVETWHKLLPVVTAWASRWHELEFALEKPEKNTCRAHENHRVVFVEVSSHCMSVWNVYERETLIQDRTFIINGKRFVILE